jgi:hypothetical protein
MGGRQYIVWVLIARRASAIPLKSKLIMNAKGEKLEAPLLRNTSDRDARRQGRRDVGEAVDVEIMGIDALGSYNRANSPVV